VEIQREVTRNLMASVAYVAATTPAGVCRERRRLDGARIRCPRRPDQRHQYQVDGGASQRSPALAAHCRNQLDYQDDIGWSSFHSFQSKVQRRFANGISTLLSYTWQKSLDISSGFANAERGIGNSHIRTIMTGFNKAVRGTTCRTF